jgi:predicted N-formylglutamate amidohydrolase
VSVRDAVCEEMADESIAIVDGSHEGLLLTCEHAGNRIPHSWGSLGLDPAFLDTHFAWDIGSERLTRALAQRLAAPAVLATYSRLFYDINRSAGSTQCIRTDLSGIPVPGNMAVDDAERALRKRICADPFESAVMTRLACRPAVVSIHTCTPLIDGQYRRHEVSVLWRSESQIGQSVLDALRADGRLRVGENEPYDLRAQTEGSLLRLALPLGLPFIALEIRSDVPSSEPRFQVLSESISVALGRALSAGCAPAHVSSHEDPK